MVPNTGTNGQLGAIIGTQTNVIMKVNNQKDYVLPNQTATSSWSSSRLWLRRDRHQGFNFVMVIYQGYDFAVIVIKALTLLWSSSRLWLCRDHHQGFAFVGVIIKAMTSSRSSSRLLLCCGHCSSECLHHASRPICTGAASYGSSV